MTTLTTLAEIETCGHCGSPVLAGWADGVRVRADLQPVVPSGEVAAIRAGLATFLLRRGRLEYRGDEQIVADRKSSPLLVTHKCARPIPAQHRDMTAAPIVIAPIIEGIPF